MRSLVALSVTLAEVRARVQPSSGGASFDLTISAGHPDSWWNVPALAVTSGCAQLLDQHFWTCGQYCSFGRCGPFLRTHLLWPLWL